MPVHGCTCLPGLLSTRLWLQGRLSPMVLWWLALQCGMTPELQCLGVIFFP